MRGLCDILNLFPTAYAVGYYYAAPYRGFKANRLTSRLTFDYFDASSPLPCVMISTRLMFAPILKLSVVPFAHLISSLFIFVLVPKPMCKRASFCEA